MIVCALLAVGCSQQVQTGEIKSCKHCKKDVSNTISVISVPTWKAKEYSVKRSETYCQSCGDEQVAYKLSTKCSKCMQAYKTEQMFAQRKTEPRDKTETKECCQKCIYLVRCERCANKYVNLSIASYEWKTAGFCSDKCRIGARVDSAIDKSSEKVGDILGRTAKGLLDGIKKHAK